YLRLLHAPPSTLLPYTTLFRSSRPLTQEGRIVGTFQYMAPEQVQGQEADARTDIFALGAVLYEMLTGKRAFAGKTQISVMSAILDRKSTRLNSSHLGISYAVFC